MQAIAKWTEFLTHFVLSAVPVLGSYPLVHQPGPRYGTFTRDRGTAVH